MKDEQPKYQVHEIHNNLFKLMLSELDGVIKALKLTGQYHGNFLAAIPLKVDF